MSFKIGDRVVHPRYGLGQVVKLSVKQIEQGEKRPFYEISFPGSTLWVPINHSTSAVRQLTVKSEIADCRRLLKTHAMPLNDDPRLRQAELTAHLKLGTLTAHCEVVRDLTFFASHKPLSGSLATFLNMTLDVLYQEWAAVEEMSCSDAAIEIESLLKKGRQANNNG